MSPINLILNKYSVHIPSIARARLLPTFFLRRPQIYIDCHNGRDAEINYPLGGWDDAKRDFNLLQSEMTRVQTLLASKNVKNSSDLDSDSENDMK